ncbi:MAG: carboxypeptidase-like regulatory domain-containing protein, partial [Alphaproteobacteria bacterium]|nr:carboxypeptidase-like regulatory domain-containing protein [Alphaproteobacteria bacterium]
LDAGSIADPLLSPVTQGYTVVTRPGDNVVADFPLVHMTVIDGTVYFLDRDGSKRELGNVVVELGDKAGKPLRRVISGVDGYFSFDRVQVGDYILTVPGEALADINADVVATIPVIIEKIDEFMTGNELLLRQKTDLSIPPPMERPTSEGAAEDK